MDIGTTFLFVLGIYDDLDCLNNLTHTAYRDRCHAMAMDEEKRRRQNFKSRSYPKHANLKDTAKFFVVRRIIESLLGKRLTIKDLIHTQPSAVYAASLVENYQDEIRKVLGTRDLVNLLGSLDYCDWITDWRANESGASDGYQPGPGGCKNTINWGK